MKCQTLFSQKKKKKNVLTPKALIITAVDGTLKSVLSFSRENKAWHFI